MDEIASKIESIAYAAQMEESYCRREVIRQALYLAEKMITLAEGLKTNEAR